MQTKEKLFVSELHYRYIPIIVSLQSAVSCGSISISETIVLLLGVRVEYVLCRMSVKNWKRRTQVSILKVIWCDRCDVMNLLAVYLLRALVLYCCIVVPCKWLFHVQSDFSALSNHKLTLCVASLFSISMVLEQIEEKCVPITGIPNVCEAHYRLIGYRLDCQPAANANNYK